MAEIEAPLRLYRLTDMMQTPPLVAAPARSAAPAHPLREARPRMGATLLAAALLMLGACGDDGPEGPPDTGGTDDVAVDVTQGDADDAATDADVRDCDDSHGPVVMAHGFLASGDTWASQVQRFASNGWCEDTFYIFDWNSLAVGADNGALLDAFIDDVLAETGAAQVTLVGHSAGGKLGYTYLRSEEHAAKVARYVHVASNSYARIAGPADALVPTLNLYSPDDLIVTDSGPMEGATNVSLDGADHYAVATSAEAFEAMYRFIADEAPSTTDIEPDANVVLAGRVVTLGENQVPVGATVSVYLISEQDGSRRRDDPVQTFTVGADGYWGPIQALETAAYEFRVTGPDRDSIPISYYRERQRRSNGHIYLRTMPPPNSIAGTVVSQLPFDRPAAVLAVFSASRGLLAGTDTLTIGGTEALLETTANAETNMIALFAYDENDNMESELTSVGAFASFPFLSGLDLYLAGDGRSTRFTLNGTRSVSVIRRPGTEGASIAVFD